VNIRLRDVVGYHTMARERATYIYGCRPAPEARVPTAAEVAAWRARWGATCRDPVARILCALEQEFAPLSPTRGAESAPPYSP